ncbi:GntR family transcriptional regulator [Streptomyces sp. NPDC048209]|uniref:GntR family transcriptional regulator n=1 Tax=Streptomyces TaxID=1883 RepID=UPI0034320F9E
MPKLEQSKPPYIQIFENLRGQILRGELTPGDPIPTLRTIADDWGVSQVTASKAVGLLQEEKYVTVGGPGLRTTVRDPKNLHRNGRDRAKSVRRTGRIYTTGEYAKITSAEVVPAPADVAAVLGLQGVEPTAIKRVRVTYGPDDKPVSASISWFDGALAESAPKLLEPDRITEGTWGYVEQQTDMKATRGRDQISTRLATEEDAELLDIELPAAVKVSTTLLWTADDVVIEYGVSVAGPGRESTYDYDLADNDS